MTGKGLKVACGLAAAALVWCAPAPAQTAGGKPLRIGQSAGVTGPVAGVVKEQIAGAQVYLRSVNDKGGVNGRPVELITYDDGFNPARTPGNVRKLVEQDNVLALFMIRGTAQAESALPILVADKVPLVAPLTGAISMHRPFNRYVFNVRAKYQDEIAQAVRHLVTSGVTKIAIFHSTDSFGGDLLEGYYAALQSNQLKPAAMATFTRPMGDISAGAAAIARAQPEAVLVAGSGSEATRIIRAVRKAGASPQFVTLSNNAAESFIKELGDDGHGLIITEVVPGINASQMTIASEYRNQARQQGASVSNAGMEGYMSAKVLVEGLRRAGPDPTREKLVAALESMRNYDLGGLLIHYSPTSHAGASFVEMSIISSTGKLIR